MIDERDGWDGPCVDMDTKDDGGVDMSGEDDTLTAT